MFTTLLATLLDAVGLAGIVAGAYQLVRTRTALRERAFNTVVAVGSIVGGLVLLGFAQTLRILRDMHFGRVGALVEVQQVIALTAIFLFWCILASVFWKPRA